MVSVTLPFLFAACPFALFGLNPSPFRRGRKTSQREYPGPTGRHAFSLKIHLGRRHWQDRLRPVDQQNLRDLRQGIRPAADVEI